MLSIFPSLFAFEAFAPLLLRLVLGAILLQWGIAGIRHHGMDKAIAIGQIVVGGLFVLGLWTQLASLATLIFFGIKIECKIRNKAFLTDGVNYYLILFIISLTLLFTGPGFFSFDLPL